MRKGETTREAIVGEALRQAVVTGVEAVTLGPLADSLRLSKSGLYAHFRSKEALQLAVIEEAVDRFRKIVVLPALRAEPGLARLKGLFENHLSWIAGDHEAGGCVFSIANQEFDDRPGAIRDQLAAAQREWRALLAQCVREAQSRKELPAAFDPDQIAFEIVGASLSFNVAHRLLGAKGARKQALKAFERVVGKAKS